MNVPEHGTAELGARLRELRMSRNLSLRQLAQELGTSPSSLSMLENGKCGVALRRLRRLADFYGLTISRLMAGSGQRPTSNNTAITRFPQVLESDGFVERGRGVWYRLLDVGPGSTLQPFVLRLEPRAGFLRDALAHRGEEFVFTVQGEMELWVGNGSRTLKEGDVAHFDSSLPHAYQNRTDEMSIAVGAATPPW
ncbi:MAG: helix-turn-helix domain-containing protein [Actinomycetota bacterium]